MASWVRLAALAACTGLALLGLALGAQSQRETVLESDVAAQAALAAEGAAGNLVILTGAVASLGATLALLLLSRLRWRERAPLGLAFLGACYGAVVLTQTMWPTYFAVAQDRLAVLANSLLATNLEGSPSVLLAALAPMLGLWLLAGWLAMRLLGHRPPPATAEGLLREQAAATLLATPFLAIAAWGNLRILLQLPDDRPGLGPAFVLLPAALLACLALVGLAVAKAWHLGTYVRNARLAGAVQDAWGALGRAEAILAVVLGTLALAGSFLPTVKMPGDLELGSTLGMDLRVHTQALVLLAVPLAVGQAAHGRGTRLLREAPLHPPTLDAGTSPVAVWTLAATAASVAFAAVGTFAIGPALWPWLLAVLPAAVAAAVLCGPRPSAPVALLLALVLWAIGNTVLATYDGRSGNASLSFHTAPGLLALLRTLGALVAAFALTRLAHGLARGRAGTWPLAAGAGGALAAVALLEMPLTAWLVPRPGVDAIAVGSVLRSLDPPVRAIVHTVSAVLAVAAATLVALLHRPDWFGRRPRSPVATAAIRAKRAPRDGKAPA